MREIKAVFMDVDDTLLDFNECARENIRQCCALNGIVYNDHIFDIFLVRNIDYWKRIERGELTVEELHRTRWAAILGELGIEADGQKFEQDFIKGMPENAIPVKGALELMQYLHGKYKVFIVSNATVSQQKKRLTKAGLIDYVDDIFGSLDIGFNKPDARYYEYCWQHTGGIGPENTIIIGDSLTADIKGGLEQGMMTCWLNHRNSAPDPQLRPDYTVTTLSAIIQLL